MEDLDDKKNKTVNNPVWDTDSSLYDSFELKSFENSLKSAIASRTLSMPHLSSSQPQQPPPPRHHPTTCNNSNKSKFSKQFQKLVRTLFGSTRHKYRNRDPVDPDESRFYMVLPDHNSSGASSTALSTIIHEVRDTGRGFSVVVGRTVSDRFGPVASIGMVIPCA